MLGGLPFCHQHRCLWIRYSLYRLGSFAPIFSSGWLLKGHDSSSWTHRTT
jgi:hypothetical protein